MSGTSASLTFTYDVFLNFRGTDTRHGFIGHLRQALYARGICAFIDDEDLKRGQEITSKLEEAIKKSRIAIIVLSENYASSSYCLKELSYILKCFHGIKDRLILPVFYKVDPSDVEHQKGTCQKAWDDLVEKHSSDKLQPWKQALRDVANLAGDCFQLGPEYEHEFITKIVNRVWSEINYGAASIHVADYQVEDGSQIAEIRKLLDVRPDDNGVHMIGIYGMGGVGKSTLATAVYNMIADQFDGSCFLQNVRVESYKHGLKELQSVILSQILGKVEIKLASEQQGTSMIQKWLKVNKVLVVLDDVDKIKQLQGIVGRPEWFGPGSRVIITTRDKQLLASHGVERTYEVKKMRENDALQLLKWKAFRTEEVDPSYKKVLNEVVTYASGLPLALEVIGSNLFKKTIKEWESAIKRYKRIPENGILEILKVSFDALGEEERSVFLDIACCMKGQKLTEVEDMLGRLYNHCMKYHIGVLAEKCLIKISGDRVVLHDLIENMGKEIDRQKSPKEPGKRRRLWISKDIIQVLKGNTATSETEIINWNVPTSYDEETIECYGSSFKEMNKLKVFIIENGKYFKPTDCPPNVKLFKYRRES